MMKSPTSLITIRNAVGVMLAMSAIFAVVLTAISIPSDEARAQVTDPIEERAKAWWALLSNEQRVNVLEGKEADHDATADGRQLGDPDRTADVELSAVEQAQKDFDDLIAANQTEVREHVDGDPTTGGGDLYAVGDHLGNNIEAFSGFQSVQIWWDHTDCREMRISTGEDNDGTLQDPYDDPFTTETETTAETSNFCGMFADLGTEEQARVNEIGQAILGLPTPEPTLQPRGRDAQWWNELDARQMVNALYGSGADIGDPTRTPPDDGSQPFTRPELAQKMYDDLDAVTKALVTDRWRWIYDDGGRNDMGISRIVYWWNNIECDEMRIAVGTDNNGRRITPPAPAQFCSSWDGLNPAGSEDNDGQLRQIKVFELGYAIVFPNNDDNPVPDIEAWWNTLNADQMVYVVYGNPPMRTAYDDPDDDPDAGATVTTVTDDDKAVFQKMYDGLTGGIEVETASTALSTHLPAYVVEMLARNTPAGFTTTATTDDKGTTDTADDTFYYSAKAIVNAIANEIFDPPTQYMAWVRANGDLVDTSAETGGTAVTVLDDDDFDWPYTPVSDTDDLPDNLAATVADWWERTDCRVMRIAVGEDNNYLNAAVPDTSAADEPSNAMDAETSASGACGHFPGSLDAMGMRRAPDGPGILSQAAQDRVEVVGKALLGLDVAGRPSFNEPAEGIPTISGVAQVGSELTSAEGTVDDEDGVGDFMYQWLRDGMEIPGATQSKYTLGPDDNGKSITVRYSFIDGERYYEMRVSNATSTIAGSPGEISRIEPSIRGVTVSSGDTVKLSVEIYGLQNSKDNSIGGTFTWTQNGDDIDGAGNGREITYTAPSSPGTYTVKAELDGGSCQPADEEMRDAACSAEITVQVRRPSAPVEPDPEPVNPPGDIPTILTDSDGNQYEVFTPVDGGTFDSGEGYRIHVPSGAVPNGEFIGIRMADGGAASNIGMTHQRYTLGGNMYGIHAVDASGAAVSSYELDDPATVCLPLPAALRSSIADLAVVSINSDGSLTVHSASVRIGEAGTQVCGNVSGIPTSVAVGSQGAPDAIPTPVVEVPVLPETGATAPSSNGALFALLLGIATLSLGTLVAVARRRNRSTSR